MDPLLAGLLILSVLLLISTLLPWLIASTRRPKPTREELISVLRCVRCGYEEVRKYDKGDYVGKPVNTCPKDGGQVVVKAIYVESFPQS